MRRLLVFASAAVLALTLAGAAATRPDSGGRGGVTYAIIGDTYLPTERLARVRQVFYPKPKQSLGVRTKFLDTQADEPGFGPYVENTIMWKAAKVVFATVHAVGSANGLAPWFGGAETAEQRALRLAEYEGRLAAGLAWIDKAFDRAEAEDARGVAVAMQADTWAGTADGFRELVQRLAERAAAFGKPVLVLQGDTHEYLVATRSRPAARCTASRSRLRT